MFLLGFALILACVPMFPEGATTSRWALLCFTLPGMVMLREFRHVTWMHVIGGFGIGWALLSLLWTTDPYEGTGFIVQFLLMGCAFLVATTMESPRALYMGMGLGLWFNGLVMFLQLQGLTVYPQLVIPGGLFFNKDFAGEAAALVLIGLVGERVWWVILGVLPTLFMATSRASYLALVMAGIVWLWQRSPRAASVLLLVTVCGLVTVFELRGYNRTMEVANSTLLQRIAVWQDTLTSLTFWGHGIGSFYQLFPLYQKQINPAAVIFEHPHNDFLQIVFELGVVGGVVFVAFLVFAMFGTRTTERLIVVAFVVEGMFGFPLYNPVTQFVFCTAAGLLAGRLPLLWDSRPREQLGVLAGMARARLQALRSPPAL